MEVLLADGRLEAGELPVAGPPGGPAWAAKRSTNPFGKVEVSAERILVSPLRRTRLQRGPQLVTDAENCLQMAKFAAL
jgi:hypothetical protein